jgi:hypothetical protein
MNLSRDRQGAVVKNYARGWESSQRKHWFAVSLWLVLGPSLSCAADLQPETVKAWNHYIEQAKLRMNSRLDARSHFLWLDEDPARARRVRSGEITVAPVNGSGRTKVSNGLIHDWVGAAFVPNATIENVFSTMDEYSCYKDFYAPTVIDSRLLSHAGTESSFSMRWMRKTLFVTTVLDGDYTANYFRRNETSRYGFAWSTRIQEVANFGQPSEFKLAPGAGSGYIWHVFSISRFEEREGGVYVELEAMALSRSAPASLSWLVNPIINRLSQSALVTSLSQMREAVQTQPQRTRLNSCSLKTEQQRAGSPHQTHLDR